MTKVTPNEGTASNHRAMTPAANGAAPDVPPQSSPQPSAAHRFNMNRGETNGKRHTVEIGREHAVDAVLRKTDRTARRRHHHVRTTVFTVVGRLQQTKHGRKQRENR